jgi:cobalt transporter subunit CbtB
MPQTHTAELSAAGHSAVNTAGTAVDTRVVAQAVLAMVLGLFVVGVVGFSHISAVHNAAHDVRHANAFPCH